VRTQPDPFLWVKADLVCFSRPPVLFAIDAVNSLFCETEYRDPESNPLTGEQLTIIRALLDLFVERPQPIPKAVVLGAMDSTETVSRSPFLEQILRLRMAPWLQSTSGKIVLPEKLAPSTVNPLASSKLYQSVGKLANWVVYPYDRSEVESVLDLYRKSKMLKDAAIPQDVQTAKFLALSGGNPLKVFKLASLVRVPGSPPPKTKGRGN